MFWRRRVNPIDQGRVLGWLVRYEDATAELKGAHHATSQFPNITSYEFEEARKAHLTILNKVQAEINDPSFWPALHDDKGLRILLEVRSKFADYIWHERTFLRLLRAEAESLKAGKGKKQETAESVLARNHAVEQVGVALTKLLRHYRFDKWTPEDYRYMKNLFEDFESVNKEILEDFYSQVKESNDER